MPSTPIEMAVIVYAPASQGNDGRALTIVHGLERALPGLHLKWTSSEKEDLIPLASRDEWVVANGLNGSLPFLCNDDDNNLVTISGWENPNGLALEGPPHFEVHADFRMETFSHSDAANALEAIADGARALWGHATPFKAAVEIAEQTAPALAGPPSPPKGLPVLNCSWDISSPEIPHRLGWLNYWSATSARALGFPDPSRDADLLSRARRTATNGWLVRLTDEPLDLDKPAHLDTLLKAYERFPKIGGR
ncbi:DUF5953 family protein [Corallococcus aberystwythensis]|uniref:Uncharacterized protein n=1 Tax=Corallococcus aberystwythensis TaxID=2316722 RepID=A0A3A8PYT7_9BACT|nr:DUF5953 family protein [Corallococcus aberystwythensis]RKH57652.1 hypothetical protein D7W81_30685 [Corallococcus aberystwythensis]